MKILKKLSIFAVFAFVLFFPVKIFAEDGAGFTVTPNLGKGQTNETTGFFSIQGQKDESYPVTVNIQNLTTDKTQEFDVDLVQATTSNNGRIDYTPNQKAQVKGGVFLKDLLINGDNSSQKVKIEAGKTKEVTFHLQIPKEGIQGVILGSVYVKKIPNEETKAKGMGIRNAFAMTIPVKLSEDFNKKITPKLELTEAKLKSDSGLPKIVGVVSNAAPSMFGQIYVDAWVTQKGKSDKLYQSKSEKYEMAPYSSFEYTIDTNNHLLKPGKYTYYMSMKSGDKKFDMKRDFTVDSKGREIVNNQLLDGEKSNINLWWIITAVIIAIVVIFFLAFYLGKSRGKDVNEN